MEIQSDRPWYETTLRWGQLNLKEDDPRDIDVKAWGRYFERSKIGALIINAGGLVAYYPSRVPLHRRSPYLGERDLFGELLAEARQRHIRVLARFTPTRMDRALYYEHPDWFALDRNGNPFIDTEMLYRTCTNGGFQWEQLPRIINEVIARYDVDGIFINQWHGIEGICQCANCRRLFHEATGKELPSTEDWSDPTFIEWLDWRYERNRLWHSMIQDTIRRAKPSAIWISNQWGDMLRCARACIDLREFAQQQVVMELETQGRAVGVEPQPLWWAAEQGKLMRCISQGKPYANLFGYVLPGIRLLATGSPELKIWMSEIVASGTRPWYHILGATQEDRRSLETIEQFFREHAENDDCYQDLESAARVALVFSERSINFYGHNRPEERFLAPFRGYYYALLQAGIPFDLIHQADLSEETLSRYDAVVLPNAACLRDTELNALIGYARHGGGLVATYESGRYDERGGFRRQRPLDELLGIASRDTILDSRDSYMRIESRLPLTEGLGDTDVVVNGRGLLVVDALPGAETPLTLIPPFVKLPPERAFPTIERTGRPVVVIRETEGRTVYFASPLDAEYWERNLPDHGVLLVNAVRWVARRPLVSFVEGGLVDLHAYYQKAKNALVAHLVHLGHPNLWKPPLDRLVTSGPLKLQLELPNGAQVASVALRRSGVPAKWRVEGNCIQISLPPMTDYEIVWVQLSRNS